MFVLHCTANADWLCPVLSTVSSVCLTLHSQHWLTVSSVIDCVQCLSYTAQLTLIDCVQRYRLCPMFVLHCTANTDWLCPVLSTVSSVFLTLHSQRWLTVSSVIDCVQCLSYPAQPMLISVSGVIDCVQCLSYTAQPTLIHCVQCFSPATNEQAPQGSDLPSLPEAGQDRGWRHHSRGPQGGVQRQEAPQVPQRGVDRGSVLEALPRLLWQPGQGRQGEPVSGALSNHHLLDCCYSGAALYVVITVGCPWLSHSSQVHKSPNTGWFSWNRLFEIAYKINYLQYKYKLQTLKRLSKTLILMEQYKTWAYVLIH